MINPLKGFQDKRRSPKRRSGQTQECQNIDLIKYFYKGKVRLRYEYTNKPPAGVWHLKNLNYGLK